MLKWVSLCWSKRLSFWKGVKEVRKTIIYFLSTPLFRTIPQISRREREREREEKSFEPRWPRYDFPCIPRSAELGGGRKIARKIKQTWRFLSVHKTPLHQLLTVLAKVFEGRRTNDNIAQFFLARRVLISLIAAHGGAQLEFMIPDILLDGGRQSTNNFSDHNWLPSPKTT